MSKRETPMILAYWEHIGGTLIEEHPAVRQKRTTGPRWIDAVILPTRETTRLEPYTEVSLEGEEVIVVQCKVGRIGMYLAGQALFSIDLIKRLGAASVKSVALCNHYDDVIGPLLEAHGVEIVTMESPSVLLQQNS